MSLRPDQHGFQRPNHPFEGKGKKLVRGGKAIRGEDSNKCSPAAFFLASFPFARENHADFSDPRLSPHFPSASDPFSGSSGRSPQRGHLVHQILQAESISELHGLSELLGEYPIETPRSNA